MKQRLLFFLILLLSIGSTYAQININMPTSGRINTCSANFYDNGGPTGNYGNGLTQVFTICPDFPQSAIQIVFNEFNLQNTNDVLYIYDGENVNAPLLETLSGQDIPLAQVASGTNTSGCLTFRFTSDGQTSAPGWFATVSCVTPCQVINASLESSFPARNNQGIIKACIGEPISLNGAATFSRSNSGAVYTWNLDDGRTVAGQNAIVTYNQPGIYRVNLFVTDPLNCRNNNRINQVIQVSPRPAVTADIPTDICFGEETRIDVDAVYERITRPCAAPVSGTTFLPDGNNNIYSTSISVDCFAANQLITAGNQVSVCINMEHSFSNDLSMRLISPNGRVILLHNRGGNGTYFGHPIDNDNILDPGTGETYCFSMDGDVTIVNAPTTQGGAPGYQGQMYVPGTYLPVESFDNFVGSSVNGVWTLQIHDQAGSDNGYIFWWDLSFSDDILPDEYAFQSQLAGISVPLENGVTEVQNNYFIVKPERAGNNCWPVTFIDDSGCTFTQEFCANVTPEIQAGQPRDLEDCINVNRIAEFDLNDVLLDITDNPFLRVTFHDNEEEALEGVSPLINLQTRTILEGERTIWVRIFNTENECSTFRTFKIIPKDCSLVLNRLADLSICQGDVNSFDLTQYDTVVYNNNLGFEVNYFNTEDDALNNINPINRNLAQNYQATHGETIYVRVTNINDDENFEVTSFKLWVNQLPIRIPMLPISSCEINQAGLARFNLIPAITNANGGGDALEVTFYDNLQFAELGDVQTQLPLDYTGPQGTIYVRVFNPNTGCYIVSELELRIVSAPVVSYIQPLVLCDSNNDGRAVFNLEPTAILIAGNPLPQNMVVSYHETLTDAELNQNQIVNINTYENVNLYNQTIYVRVALRNSSCSSIVPLQLQVFDTPQLSTPTPLVACDNDKNGMETVDLTTKISEVLNGLNQADYTITFHLTQAQADNDTNPIVNVRNFSTQTAGSVFIRVENNITGCYSIVRLLINTQAGPTLPNVVPTFTLCDANADGFEVFNLQSRIPGLIGTQTGVVITFHYTADEAQSGTNPLPNMYQNVVQNIQTLHVRAYNTSTGCYTTSTMDIKVVPNPIVNVPTTPFVICNPAGTGGFGTIDLTVYINPLIAGSGFMATYHETEFNAINNVSPIALPTNYNNLQSSNPVVYVRIVSIETGCFTVYPLRFQLIAAPNVPLTLPAVTACDNFNDRQDGLTVFDLTVQNQLILNANSGNLSGFVIKYYESEAHALAGINWIANPTEYNNRTVPQTIWVSVENELNPGGCKRYGSFELVSYLPVVVTQPTAISMCETSLPNDGREGFDLTIRESEILGGNQVFEARFYYYESAIERENRVNPIANPTEFYTVQANQMVYVEVVSENGCISHTSLQLRVLPLPEINTSPAPVEECENDEGTGFGFVDLTQAEVSLSNSIPNLSFVYYNNYDGAVMDDPNSVIGTPDNYFSTTSTVYVKISNNPTVQTDSCSIIVPLQVVITSIPRIGNLTPLFVCLEDAPENYTFNLREKDNEVLSGQNRADFTIKYFATELDAIGNVNPIPYMYRNVDPVQQTIFVRIENNNTGCFNVGEFIIRVEEKIHAFPPSSVVFCEIDFVNDWSTPVDLTILDEEIISIQEVQDLSVRYYTSTGAAIANPREYRIRHGEEIIALVYSEEPGSLCTGMITFTVYTKEGPEIKEIPSGVICYDFRDPAKVLNPYLMDTGLPQSSNYIFEWTLNGNIVGTDNTYVAVQPGNYTVTVTYVPTGCVNSRTIEVRRAPSISIDEVIFSESFEERMVVEVIAITDFGFELEYKMDEGSWQSSNIFDNVTPGEHYISVRVKNADFCPAEEVIQVLSHPLYFTPNGDGFNDTWNITSLKYQPEAQVHIFDRYGKLIKTISPSGPGWDGTFNGKDMPSTDYWFKATYVDPVTGNEKESTGHFSLKR